MNTRSCSAFLSAVAIAVFSSPFAFADIPIRTTSTIVVEASGDWVVTDFVGSRVIRIDPTSTTCSVVTSFFTGSGASLPSPHGIAVEASGDLVVTQGFPSSIVRVDPVSGVRTVVSDDVTGAGPSVFFGNGIAVDASGDLLAVALMMSGQRAILRVDPVTGDRTVVSGDGVGTGPAIHSGIRGFAAEASGDIVLANQTNSNVLRIDPVTGDRTVVSDGGTGSGDPLATPDFIAVEASGDLVVTDIAANAIVRIDPVTGDRTYVSNAVMGTGPIPDLWRGLAIEATGDLVTIAFETNGLIRVDPATGDRELFECGCPPSPKAPCTDAAQAQLQYNEKKVGKEKMKLQWKKVTAPTTAADFGDATAEFHDTLICIYNDANALVEQFHVWDSDFCGLGGSCWSAKGSKGYQYKENQAQREGITKVGFKSGGAGKGKADVKGGNNSLKSQAELPTGIVAQLTTNTAPTIQMLTVENDVEKICLGATMTNVKKDDGVQYQAQKK